MSYEGVPPAGFQKLSWIQEAVMFSGRYFARELMRNALFFLAVTAFEN